MNSRSDSDGTTILELPFAPRVLFLWWTKDELLDYLSAAKSWTLCCTAIACPCRIRPARHLVSFLTTALGTAAS